LTSSSNKYVTRSVAVASRMLGDETIIMSTTDSTLFSLNAVGSFIWEAADGCTPLACIVEEKVCAAFHVTLEQARADVEEFVNELAEHGILVVSDGEMPRQGTQ
jgi:hypothetical protein